MTYIAHDFFLIFSACAQNILKSETQRVLPLLSTTYYWADPHYDCNGPVHNSTKRA